MSKAYVKLQKFYKLFSSNEDVLVLINADPDSIASAMAIKRLLWRKVSNITISNINVIKRPDNLAMIRLLGIKLIHIKKIDINKYHHLIIVDSQPDHNDKFKELKFSAIIDHHPKTCNYKEEVFVDIRPSFGATATILTQYLIAADIKPSMKLATALFLGIKIDTSNFERNALIDDIRAFQFLFKYVNTHLARQIEREDLQFDFLQYFKKALEERCVRKDKIFVHLDKVENPDICVIISEFFLRVNTINWSIISCIYDKKLIIIFRNDGIRKHAGNIAKDNFGFLGSAGGHKNMARAEIPLNNLKDKFDLNNNKQILKWIINQVEQKQQF